MESRDIYNLGRRNLVWETDWIHIGMDSYLKAELLYSILISHFGQKNTLRLRRGRENSSVLDTTDSFEIISNLVGKEDFELWNCDFTIAIRFNHIGVANLGHTGE